MPSASALVHSIWLLGSLVGCSPDDPRGRPTDDSGVVTPTDDSNPIDDADGDADGSPDDVDCDDGNAAVNPDADELCNGIDDDCDGTTDVGAVDALMLHADADGDGYGADPLVAMCDPAAGIAVGGDCDDANASVNPAACDDPHDGHDGDCNGVGDLETPVIYDLTSPACGFGFENFQTAVDSGATALRVIVSNAREPGTRTVHVTTTKPVVLVLISWWGTQWEVDETVPGTVQEIFVSSEVDVARATGPTGVPVHSYEGTDAFSYESRWGEEVNRQLAERLSELTDLSVTSWYSCNSFDEVTLIDGTSWPPSTAEYSNGCPARDATFSDPDLTILPKACGAIAAKGGTVCISTSDSGTRLFDMGGNTCAASPYGLNVDWGPGASIGWRGQYLYACNHDVQHQLVRMRLTDGAVERSYRYCEGAADWDDSLLAADVANNDRLVRSYASWNDVLSEDPATIASTAWNYSIAARDDMLFTTSAADSGVSISELAPPFAPLPRIALENYDYWIGGFDVTDDDLIVVRGRLDVARDVHVFEMDGSTRTEFNLPSPTGGVSCFTP
jgi:hypothetical protein